MAIVKMNKLSLIGLHSSKSAIIEELMNLGVVEINAQDQKLTDGDWASVVARDGNENEVVAVEAELSKVSTVLDTISRYNTAKKPLFKTRRIMEDVNFSKLMDKKEGIENNIELIYSLTDKLAKLKTEENRLNSVILSIKPWITYDLPLEFTGTKSTGAIIGVLPSIVDLSQLLQEIEDARLNCVINIIGSDTDQHYISAIYHNEHDEAVLDTLKHHGFNRVVFKDLEGNVSENLIKVDAQLKAIADDRAEIEAEITAQAASKDEIEAVYDDLIMRRDKAKILSRMLKTQKVFYLDGYVPVNCSEKVKEKLEQFECIVEIEAPEKDEECPVLLKNSKANVPYESITNLYSVPAYNTIDPTAFLAPFYFIFYGLMLSDAGYGIVMAVSCFVILRKYRLEGMAYKLITMFMYCGVSTLIWGALFGGWFGDFFQVAARIIFNKEITISPIWFNPVENPMKLLIFSFILGVIHLFLGMGLSIYLKIKSGKPMDALYDEGFWLILLVGCILLLAGGNFNGSMPVIGKYMAIVGAVGIVLFAGREKKNIFSRLLSGVLGLYNITGYLADVLSYSRLLALGLATGVIASVVNTMSSIAGGGIIGTIILLVGAVFGHIFNLAINALGSFVHASRLQYVEFFGKFFEGGGKIFEPFKKNTKYFDIISKEEM